MDSSTWYKRQPVKFIDGTMMLSLEEKGAYSLCIDLMHIHGGTIPDDDRWIAGVCGCSVRKWKAIRSRLVEVGKLTSQGGRLMNFRATPEAENYAKLRRELAERGAKGGRQRAENMAKSKKGNGLDQAAASSRVDKSRVDKKNTESSDSVLARARGARLPDDWSLPDEWRQLAIKEGLPSDMVEIEATKFANYWQAKSGNGATKRDWKKTWHNWILNAGKHGNGTGKKRSRAQAQFDAFAAISRRF